MSAFDDCLQTKHYSFAFDLHFKNPRVLNQPTSYQLIAQSNHPLNTTVLAISNQKISAFLTATPQLQSRAATMKNFMDVFQRLRWLWQVQSGRSSSVHHGRPQNWTVLRSGPTTTLLLRPYRYQMLLATRTTMLPSLTFRSISDNRIHKRRSLCTPIHLRIVHLQFRKLEVKHTESLLQLAVFCNQYTCTHLVTP